MSLLNFLRKLEKKSEDKKNPVKKLVNQKEVLDKSVGIRIAGQNFANQEEKQEYYQLVNREIQEKELQTSKQYIINKLRSAKNISELNVIFKEVLSEGFDKKFKLQNFNNSISQIKSELNEMGNILSLSGRKSVFDTLIDVFLKNNKAFFRFNKSENYNKKNIKKVVKYKLGLSSFADKKATGVVADVVRTFLSDAKTNALHYQNFNSELMKCLLKDIYGRSNAHFKDKERKQNAFRLDNLNFNFDCELAYHGNWSDYSSFNTQLMILHDRKKLVEKERRNELMILNRRYPVGERNRDFYLNSDLNFNTRRRRKDFGNLGGRLKSKFSLDFNERHTYEDRVYNMTNVFYDNKYIKIDDQERKLIGDYEKSLRDKENKKVLIYNNYYLRNNLHLEGKFKFIKEWSGKKESASSFEMFDDNNFVKNILKLTATKAKQFVSYDISNIDDVGKSRLLSKVDFSGLKIDRENDSGASKRHPLFSANDFAKISNVVSTASKMFSESDTKVDGEQAKDNNK